MRRHEAREFALQALYQADVGRAEATDSVKHILEDVLHSEEDERYILGLVAGTRMRIQEIDELLERSVQGWRLDRIARVDLNILRLALYEMQWEDDVDIATVVDEAVELAKSFSTDESSRFVNGVLARVIPAFETQRASTKGAVPDGTASEGTTDEAFPRD